MERNLIIFKLWLVLPIPLFMIFIEIIGKILEYINKREHDRWWQGEKKRTLAIEYEKLSREREREKWKMEDK